MTIMAASIVTRNAAREAYLKKKIGLTTPDIIKRIPKILAECYD